jgi:hypothetical protein
MPNNHIIKPEREGVPKIIDAALLAQAAAGQVKETRVSVHRNASGVIPGLHRKMHQLLDQLSDSFSTQMKSAGIEIGRVQVSWRPAGSEQDAYEKLTRSQLVLQLQRLPLRQSEVSTQQENHPSFGRMIQ